MLFISVYDNGAYCSFAQKKHKALKVPKKSALPIFGHTL